MSVVGPAGIGKSRLAWEFLKYIDGLIDTVYWHSGRSPAYGEGISFWALGEMVRERAGLAERDDEATTRQKIRESVAQWVPDESERVWIERALLTLLGIESGMPARPAVRRVAHVLRAHCGERPVVMVFEDMHFADSGLLDFVDHLLEWSRGFPIYVVTLARPDLIDRRPDWGAGKRNFMSMYLEPLPETDDARAARRTRARPAGRGGRRRSSLEPTGSRYMPSRLSGCCSRTAGSCRDGDVYRPARRPRRSRRSRDAHRADRGAP